MGHDKNDELRGAHDAQDHDRQTERDAAFDGSGETADLGSQDERRHEGDAAH